jgi:hypothetical protein
MPQRDPVKEKYWRGLLRQWVRSGLSVREFCDAQAISQASFYAWRREIGRRDQPPSARCVGPTAALQPSLPAPATFLKLALDASVPSAIEVVITDGRLLRVRPGFDADLLRELLRLLEEPPC